MTTQQLAQDLLQVADAIEKALPCFMLHKHDESEVKNLIAERQHLLAIISQLPNLQKSVTINIDSIAKGLNLQLKENGCLDLLHEEIDQRIQETLLTAINKADSLSINNTTEPSFESSRAKRIEANYKATRHQERTGEEWLAQPTDQPTRRTIDYKRLSTLTDLLNIKAKELKQLIAQPEPDAIAIMDIAIEEMEEIQEWIAATLLGNTGSPLLGSYSDMLAKYVVVIADAPETLPEGENFSREAINSDLNSAL